MFWVELKLIKSVSHIGGLSLSMVCTGYIVVVLVPNFGHHKSIDITQ